MTTTLLIDKSALVRLGASPDAPDWARRIERGLVTITVLTLLEAGFSAPSSRDHERLLGSVLLAAMAIDHLTPAIEDRALEVQRLLAQRGHHWGPSIPHLLIASTGAPPGIRRRVPVVRIDPRTIP